MAQSVKITITGSGETGHDAPSAEDFLGQVSDFLAVLKNVEQAIDEKGETQLTWKVTNAHMNSPLLVELTPFSKIHGVFIGDRAEQVESVAFRGMTAIGNSQPVPNYFSEESAKRARSIHSRVTAGLAKTTFKFEEKIASQPLEIDRLSATRYAAASKAASIRKPVPYREIGSIEGFVTKAELDGYGRAVLRFRSRLSDEEIKAVATEHAFRQVGTMRLSDVWQGVRVRVYGTISYRDLGKIDAMQATGIEILDQAKLPSLDTILDETFTGGLTSEQYLEALHSEQ